MPGPVAVAKPTTADAAPAAKTTPPSALDASSRGGGAAASVAAGAAATGGLTVDAWDGAWVAPAHLQRIEVSEDDVVAAMTPVLKLSHVIAAKRSAHKIKIIAAGLVASKMKALAAKKRLEREANEKREQEAVAGGGGGETMARR